MNKQILVIALLLAVVSAQSEFAPRKCLADVKDGIELAHSIQEHIQSKNLTGLIENGVAAFELYERAAADCTFGEEEIVGGLVACIKDIKELIPVLQEVNTNLNPLNITGLIENVVVVLELADKIKVDCAKEVQELFEIEFPMLSQSEEEEQEEDDGFPHPVKCLKHAANFTGELKKFIREERNHSLTPEQTFNEIFFLLEDVPVVLTDCGLPVPAFFNNTKALRNCTVALYDLYEDIVKINNDWNNKDINNVLTDLTSIFTAANEIKAYCQVSGFELELAEEVQEEEEQVGSYAECVQALEVIVADIQALEAQSKTNFTEIALEVEAIIFAVEDGLAHCGAGKIDDIIDEYFDEQCIEDITEVAILAEDIYERAQHATIRDWEKLAKEVIELVHEVQKVDDDCGIFNTTKSFEQEETFIDLLEDEGFQFNITDCLQQSETVAKDLDTLLKDIHTAKTQGFDPAEIEAITKDTFNLLDNILYDFVPACAGQDIEDDIIEYLPEACLDAIEATTLIVEDIAEHEKNVRYIITSLPALYDSLVQIGQKCENTIGLFIKPFYTVADAIQQRVITN